MNLFAKAAAGVKHLGGEVAGQVKKSTTVSVKGVKFSLNPASVVAAVSQAALKGENIGQAFDEARKEVTRSAGVAAAALAAPLVASGVSSLTGVVASSGVLSSIGPRALALLRAATPAELGNDLGITYDDTSAGAPAIAEAQRAAAAAPLAPPPTMPPVRLVAFIGIGAAVLVALFHFVGSRARTIAAAVALLAILAPIANVTDAQVRDSRESPTGRIACHVGRSFRADAGAEDSVFANRFSRGRISTATSSSSPGSSSRRRHGRTRSALARICAPCSHDRAGRNVTSPTWCSDAAIARCSDISPAGKSRRIAAVGSSSSRASPHTAIASSSPWGLASRRSRSAETTYVGGPKRRKSLAARLLCVPGGANPEIAAFDGGYSARYSRERDSWRMRLQSPVQLSRGGVSSTGRDNEGCDLDSQSPRA